MLTITTVKNLVRTVIAEGVETSAQLQRLTDNNGDLIQGYYFAKPIPESQILTFIDENIRDSYWQTNTNKANNKANN